MVIELMKTHETYEETVKFVAPRPKAKLFREALVFSREKDLNDMDAELLDELVQYVCDVFGNQFTINDVYEGYESGDLVDLITEAINYVVNKKGTDDKKK